jgi:putative DNA primase/helicase
MMLPMIDKIRAILEGVEVIDEDEPDGPAPPSDPPDGQEGTSQGSGSGPRGPDENAKALIEKNARQAPTDIGNGRRLLNFHGEDIFSIFGLGWFVFDGKRWEVDESGDLVRRRAHQTAESMIFEARFINPTKQQAASLEAAEQALEKAAPLEARSSDLSDDEKQQLRGLNRIIDEGKAVIDKLAKAKAARRKYAMTSQGTNKLSSMITEARVYAARKVDDLDVDPLALNTQSGTLRFARPDDTTPWNVTRSPHAKADLLTKITGASFDETAECPAFERFLERIVPDEEARAFLKRWFGYTVTGLNHEQVFVFFYGEGANGKSTLVDTIARVLGDYAISIPFETLAGEDRRKGADATPDLVRLPGARLVRASEPEANMRLKEAQVKAFTGGEPILIRPLHKEFVEIVPEFKLVLSGNHEPVIRGGDHGIWRRTLIVPFEQQIPKDEMDRSLGDKLWAERDGVLNWLIAGCLEYLESGLKPPDAVLAATAAHRETQDPIMSFVDAAFDFPEAHIRNDEWHTPQTLYATYMRWCEVAAEKPFAQRTFSTQINKILPKHGSRRVKRNGIHVQCGFSINPEFRPREGDGTSSGPPSERRTGPVSEPDVGDDIPF